MNRAGHPQHGRTPNRTRNPSTSEKATEIMPPSFPPDHPSRFLRRRPSQDGLRDRSGGFWSSADIAAAAERGITYLNRQVLPASDPSDPRVGAHSR
jgi:hypothetical protein